MRIKDYDGQMIDIPDSAPVRAGDPGSAEKRIYDEVMGAVDEADSVLADLGPAEYIWLMSQIVMECTRRIASRSGCV